MTNLTVATSIIERLQNLGYIAYFTGGWVRDFLLNFPSDDIDIATNASVELIQTIFSKTISVGVSFGIIIVVEEGHQFEIATFRKERDYIDGRRPQFIEPCSPEEDAKRRDFTINGLFYDPLTKNIIDFVEGQKDIKLGVIKAIGNPMDRFEEDRLRMLRAIRYSTRFGFEIDHATQIAIHHHSIHLFPAVSWERIYQEFQKMELYNTLSDSLRLLLKHSLLKIIFDEIAHLEDGIILLHIGQIDHLPKKTPLIAKLSLLFHEYPLEIKLKALSKLKISRKEFLLIEYLDKLEKQLFHHNPDDYELAHLYAHEFFHHGLSFFKHLQFSKEAAFHHEKLYNLLKPFVERIEQKKPLITSINLLQEKIPSGKLMGDLLKEAEKISIREKINDPQQLLEQLKLNPLWPKNQ